MTRHLPALDLAADDAARELADVLRVTLESGRRPPCCGTEGSLWTSDLAVDRAEAAEACSGCPTMLWSACSAAADANCERYGVWAGVDRETQTSASRLVTIRAAS